MLTVKGRTAVISGGSYGPKFEMVQQLLKDGMNVTLLGHHAHLTMPALEEARKISDNVIGFECDVNDPAAVQKCLDATVERFGGVDVLIASHGSPVLPGQCAIEDMELPFWDSYIDGHVTGSYVLIKMALPYLKQSRAPRILLETSPLADDPDEEVLPFSTAKGGVEALTRGCARQLAKYGITVNCLNIGRIPGRDDSSELVDTLLKKIPLGRFCSGADITFAVEALICEEAGFITGEIFNLTGGAHVD